MGKRHYRVTFADALEAHQLSLELFGGSPGISNTDNILGAIGRPYHGYHRMIWAKGAALLHGMATSHGFTDGNKRTSLLLLLLLYERSEYVITPLMGKRWDDIVVDVVTGDMTQDQFTEWLKLKTMRIQ